MIERILYSVAFDEKWGRQMRFITGPRQSGKTTLSKLKLKREKTERLYYLWDLRSVKQRYKKQELFFTQDLLPSKAKKHWICFDEIHKISKWKNILKGVFDQTEDNYQFIVTGSAKLDISRRSGDSLSGRYFAFRLFPLTLNEVEGNAKRFPTAYNDAKEFILDTLDKKTKAKNSLGNLLEFGGFPEPFLHQSSSFLRKWSDDYLDRIVREDIGSLTKIIDRDKLYDVYTLLPEMVGNHVSENSLASHTESNQRTVKNYLKRLEDFYLTFRIPPYSRNIKRALLKASKWYLYDWTRVKKEGNRFENYVAVELNTMLKTWADSTGINYKLFYVKDKDKKETDFLLLKQNKPWLLIEVKLSDDSLEKHHFMHSKVLGDIPLLQVCRKDGVAAQISKNIFHISASRLFG